MPTTYHHVGEPSAYEEDELPTRPANPQAQAAMLVADWKACSPEQREFLSRTAKRLADITRKRKAGKR